MIPTIRETPHLSLYEITLLHVPDYYHDVIDTLLDPEEYVDKAMDDRLLFMSDVPTQLSSDEEDGCMEY